MTEKEFTPLAIKTESSNFNIDEVGFNEFDIILEQITFFSRLADTFKKALFYDPEQANERIDDLYTYDIISQGIVYEHGRSEVISSEKFQRLFHAALGKFTEAGEMLEALQKWSFGEDFDEVNFKEELGDDQWYNAIIMDVFQLDDLDDIRSAVINKLRKRFPNKFNIEDAENRNLDNERESLESDL